MSGLSDLQNAKSIGDVARILGFEKKKLSYLIYKEKDSLRYEKFSIPKKSGGTRTISAPRGGLKLLQRRLADSLEVCIKEISDQRISDGVGKYHQASHGFSRNSSIFTNAERHRNRRYVFNLDIKDFFDSINFGRVRGFFIKDKSFKLDPKVATLLAQIACFENKLPQGSPCSPVISNLIGNILDIHMLKLACRTRCTYSRYADDLTFSTNKRSFPQSVAVQSDSNSHIWLAGTELVRLINRSGFEINHKKTRMQYSFSRQSVTGLVVNEKISARSEYKHEVRAMVHRLIKTGSFLISTYEKSEDGSLTKKKVEGNIGRVIN